MRSFLAVAATLAILPFYGLLLLYAWFGDRVDAWSMRRRQQRLAAKGK